MTSTPKPITLPQFRARFELVSDWVSTGRRAQVQVTRHREMGRALEVMETMPEGTHAGYERAFTYHWEQVRRAMLRDGWGEPIRALEETEHTTLKEATTL